MARPNPSLELLSYLCKRPKSLHQIVPQLEEFGICNIYGLVKLIDRLRHDGIIIRTGIHDNARAAWIDPESWDQAQVMVESYLRRRGEDK